MVRAPTPAVAAGAAALFACWVGCTPPSQPDGSQPPTATPQTGAPKAPAARGVYEQRRGDKKMATSTGPSIVLVTIDTLSKRRMGRFGHDRRTTPELGAIMDKSVVFEALQTASPWTVPSMYSVMTGLPYSKHRGGVLRSPEGSRDTALVEGVQTLAEILQQRGYRTVAVVTNGYFMEARRLGFERGFDYYYSFHEKAPNAEVFSALEGEKNWDTLRSASYLLGGSGDRVVDIASKFMTDEGKHGTFLWVHLFDPHNPFRQRDQFVDAYGENDLPSQDGAYWMHYGLKLGLRNGTHDSDPKLEAWTKLVYDGTVGFTDHQVGRLFSRFEAWAPDDAWFAVTSDHGEELWEHGAVDHGHTMYQELLDSFLVLHNRTTAARIDKRQARHVDIFPTLCAIANARCPSPRDTAGEFGGLDLLDPQTASEAAPAVSENPQLHRDRVAVRLGDDKLVMDVRSKHYQLFDLAADPGELYPIHDDARAAPLIAQLDSLLALRDGTLRPAPQPPADLAGRLRALGYAE